MPSTFSGGPKTGHKMKLYRNTGNHGTPVWVEVTAVSDVNLSDFSLALAELKRRGNNFTKNLAAIFNSITVEFKLIHGLDPTNFDAIRTDFLAQTSREWLILNGDIATNGSEGLRLPVLIEQFPWDQPLVEVSTHDCKLAIAFMIDESGNEIDPSWATSSGGSV